MGGAVSSGRDNSELIDNLVGGNYIRSRDVERVFRALDRADYMTPDTRDQAYKDLAWRNGPLHMSAPCIYSEVMEGLELKPGLSFLNVGSGTGYLSTLVGLILGSSGISHGVEVHPMVVDYSITKLGQFIENSPTLDEFDFCEPKYFCGNGLCLAPLQAPYDRVYCGAGCPEEYKNYFQQLIKIGGILVMPLNDNLLQVKRTGPNEWTTRSLLNVSFATLRVPTKEEARELIRLDEQTPVRLQLLARSVIRECMRGAMMRRHPELREPPPRAPPAKKACPRRICIPVDDDSDVEGLNALHDLDRASGANEMNALLSLVLSMGHNRVAGALRVDPLDSSSPSSSEDGRADDDREEEEAPREGNETPETHRPRPRNEGDVTPPPGGYLTFEIHNCYRTESEGDVDPGNETSDSEPEDTQLSEDKSLCSEQEETKTEDKESTTKNIEVKTEANEESKEVKTENEPKAEKDLSSGDAVLNSEQKESKPKGSESPKATDSPKATNSPNAPESPEGTESTKATDLPKAMTSSSSEKDSSPTASSSKQRGGLDRDLKKKKDCRRRFSKGIRRNKNEKKDDDDKQDNPQVPAEVEIYLGSKSLETPSTSAMEWETSVPAGAEAETYPDRSSEDDNTESTSKTKKERQKLDSGVGEENTPSAESSTKDESDYSRRSSTATDEGCADDVKGRSRRQKRGHLSTRSSSSTDAEEGSGGCGGAPPLRRSRRRQGPRDDGSARRVRLSVVMKRGVKELPLPHALKKYVNLGRCYQF